MNKREPQTMRFPFCYGGTVTIRTVLALRAVSRRWSDWPVDRDWELIVYTSNHRRRTLDMEPEQILEIYETNSEMFLLSKGCPPELGPHHELRSNIARREHIARLAHFFRDVAFKDRDAWTSYGDVQTAFNRWAETQDDPPEYTPDLLAEAVRGNRIYRNVDPERGPGFKRFRLRDGMLQIPGHRPEWHELGGAGPHKGGLLFSKEDQDL